VSPATRSFSCYFRSPDSVELRAPKVASPERRWRDVPVEPMKKTMSVSGLDDYRLTPDGLARLGARAVTFHLQLRGTSLARLRPLTPRRRDARLRATLKRQLARLVRRFPGAALRSRAPRRGSWTLDGSLPANQIARLASRPEVASVWVSAIAGRTKYRRRPEQSWFCVVGCVAIQVEGQRTGRIDIEDRFVLVRAYDRQDAIDRLRPEWDRYARPYLNPHGYLVRWQLVDVKEVYSVPGDELSPRGTEVYSRLRTVKMKPAYRWKKPRSARSECSR
jgi:hypothetical protein